MYKKKMKWTKKKETPPMRGQIYYGLPIRGYSHDFITDLCGFVYIM